MKQGCCSQTQAQSAAFPPVALALLAGAGAITVPPLAHGDADTDRAL